MGMDGNEWRRIRDELIERADEFWLLARPTLVRSREFELDLVRDAQFWLHSHKGLPIRVVGWNEIGVPKYDPSAPWGLTDDEREEDPV
jgi:hypothetical protein